MSNSQRSILNSRSEIFSQGFKIYIKAIYDIPALKKIYANFFIDFWEMPEVQKNADLILSLFCKYEDFRKAALYKSIYYDDVELFDKCIDFTKDSINAITCKICNRASWGIMLNSVKCQGLFSSVKIYPKLIEIKNGKSPLSDLSVGHNYITDKYWLMASVYRYYNYYINMLYVPSEVDKTINTDHGYTICEFRTITRNILKYMLVHSGKMGAVDVHKFLMQHNNMSLMYEYFTNDTFAGSGHDLLDVLFCKMQKSRNIINTLFRHRCLIVLLYEKDPHFLFKYLVKYYTKLCFSKVRFLLETVFDNDHCWDFYGVISNSRGGKLSKKSRKQIYQLLKNSQGTRAAAPLF